MSEPTGTVSVEDEEPHIHLPPPSYWPIMLALGAALGLSGIIIHPAVWIVGVILVLIALAGWMRELGQDLSVAPSEPE